MKVELHINGSNQIQLKPETTMEKALLSEMLTAAGKGKVVTLQLLPNPGEYGDGVVVSVEK